MKVELYIRINELDDDGSRKPYNIYNNFTFNAKTNIEDYNLFINLLTDAIRLSKRE